MSEIGSSDAIKKILVTGGAGFIGSHYVRTLLSGGFPEFNPERVTVLDKLTYAGNIANLQPVLANPVLDFVQGDICNAALLSSLVPGHDAVVNFAAETHVDNSIMDPSVFVTTNVLGVQTLLQACLDGSVRRVVHVSTDEVYGSVATGVAPEGAVLAPNSPYTASKASGDHLARAYSMTYGLCVCITRCCNNYGPYQFPEKIIPLSIANLLDGAPICLYGDGLHRRTWLHVDDHCRAIQLVLMRGESGRVYNVGGDSELSNIQLARILIELCHAPSNMIRWIRDRPGHDRRYSLDDSVLRRMGYAPRISFADGLKATVDWYKDNRLWWEPLKQRYPSF